MSSKKFSYRNMTPANVDLYIESEIENVLKIKKSPINI